ncbi:MAG: 5'-nucleotidase C-terminal domain-containing protein [Clostridia bacterium]|nr:5'-nucleotidase C-terminal domain-containing protein [Clostridia bacterium]
MRKTLSLVLAVLMMLALLPAVKLSTAYAEDAVPTYKKVESAEDLTDGSYLVVVDSKKLDGAYYTFNGTTATSNNLVRVTDIVDNTIEGDYTANEIEIAVVEGGYTLQNSADKYLSAGDGSNTVVFGDEAVVNGITLGSDLKVSITMTTDVAREFKLNNSNDQPFFRYYKASSTGSNYYLPSLYKKVEAEEPDPSPSTDPEPSPSTEPVDPDPETTAMELVENVINGNEVVIFYPTDSKVMTAEDYLYNNKKHELVAADATLADGVLAVPDEAVRLTVEVTYNAGDTELPELNVKGTEGTYKYAFCTEDDLYLYADGTNVQLVERTEENEANTLFQLEPAEGGFYIKCDSATYNGKAQYLEYYNGYFSVYGFNDSTPNIYTFQFYAEPEDEPIVEPTGNTIILFTNDVHCGIRDGWGYAGLADLKKTLEAEGNEVILVDAGDHVQGGPIGSLTQGEAIIDIMNFVGYDLATLGNHEFDYGMDQLFALTEQAEYPYVSANFVKVEGNEPVLDAYKIFEANGKKIAFVGISTPESITKSTPTYFMNEDNTAYVYGFCQDATGEGVYTAVQNAIDAAKAEGADYVILVGHMGIDEQSSPWMSTEVIANITGADAFIDGHSHSVINEVVEDKNAGGKGVLHGQTGTKLANIGKLTIDADGGLTMEILPASEKVKDDPETDEYIKGIEDEFNALLNTVVAHTDHDLTILDPDTNNRAVRSKETNLGDLCADAYRYMFDADVAFVNGGGVRANIPTGDITFQQIINVHPFGNTAVLAEVTGQQILDALEMGARVNPGENGGFLQVAGLKYEIHNYIEPNCVVGTDKMWAGPVDASLPYRVQNVQVLNKETGEYEDLDLEKKYTLASHNYMLMDMGDGFAMFGPNITILEDSGKLDNQVLIDYIQSMPEVDGVHQVEGYTDPKGEGRIKIFTEVPKVLPTFYGEDVMAADVLEEVDGEELYRYDVKVKNFDPETEVVGMQMFVAFDNEALEFVNAYSVFEGNLGVNEADGVLSFAWATSGEGVTIEDETVIVSFYFKLIKPLEDGEAVEFLFVPSANDGMTGYSYVDGETVVEAAEVSTEDGSITFSTPSELTIYGEDVMSLDVMTVENGERLYRYDIRVKDLPAAGLKVNSAQIFLACDELLELRKSEGMFDWTMGEKNGKLMFVWASETPVELKNDDIVLTLYFAAPNAKGGEVAQIAFTMNTLNTLSAMSIVYGGEVLEIEASTVDGSITFAEVTLGDANCDGHVTAADAALILRSLVGLAELSEQGALNADVDGDCEVTAEDAALILRYIVKLIEVFPVEE